MSDKKFDSLRPDQIVCRPCTYNGSPYVVESYRLDAKGTTLGMVSPGCRSTLHVGMNDENLQRFELIERRKAERRS